MKVEFKQVAFHRKKENVVIDGRFMATINKNSDGKFVVDCFDDKFEWFSDMMYDKTFDTIEDLHDDVLELVGQINLLFKR